METGLRRDGVVGTHRRAVRVNGREQRCVTCQPAKQLQTLPEPHVPCPLHEFGHCATTLPGSTLSDAATKSSARNIPIPVLRGWGDGVMRHVVVRGWGDAFHAWRLMPFKSGFLAYLPPPERRTLAFTAAGGPSDTLRCSHRDRRPRRSTCSVGNGAAL